jgi:mono/diheme cytochrome c family protein
MTLATTASFATVYRTIGLTLFAIVVVATVVYVLVNVLFAGKQELGAELELAANRKPYYDDETLEGRKIERSLGIGLLLLFVLAVGIPLYWVMEPARQDNAATGFGERFASRGEALFAATGENPQALNCAGCHGGLQGGFREDFVLTTPNPEFDPEEAAAAEEDGEVYDVEENVVDVVNWRAPALGSVLLRYSREEVTFILTYGRPGTPMPAWGVEGGGPLNAQQIQNLIDFLEESTISPEQAQADAQEALDTYMAAEFEDTGEPVFQSEGEALFNLGLLDNFRGGAYSCARCHTSGWAAAASPVVTDETGAPVTGDADQLLVDRDAFEEITANSGCGGALGPNLCDGATIRQFPLADDHALFVTDGSQLGIGYGRTGQGSGKMPGFGLRPAETGLFWIDGGADREPGAGMLTPEMITEIVAYERELRSTGTPETDPNGAHIEDTEQ